MVKDMETRALNVLAKATADVAGRHAVYRKVLRVATTKKPEDYDDAREAFDAQEPGTRNRISDRAQVRATEDRDQMRFLREQMEVERIRTNRAAAEKDGEKTATVQGQVWG